MASQKSSASFAQNDAANMLENILGQLPVVSSCELLETRETVVGEQTVDVDAIAGQAVPQSAERLAKLKRKLNRVNNYMVELTKKIREKESMKPKENCDRDELAFLRNRLRQEVELQDKLLKEVVAEQQRCCPDGKQWQSIRLCPGKLDEHCTNPWTMGSLPMHEGKRFSCDPTPSSSHDESAGCDAKIMEQLEKELLSRDRVIEILQSRQERLTADMCKLRQDNDTILGKRPNTSCSMGYCKTDMQHRLDFYRTNMDTVIHNLEEIKPTLQSIMKDLDPVGGQRSEDVLLSPNMCATDRRSTAIHHPCDADSSENNIGLQPAAECLIQCPQHMHMQLQKKYDSLQQEYNKKIMECQQLSDQLVKALALGGSTGQITEDTEMLKKHCVELLEKQDDFQVLIREQAIQLEAYQAKYLEAERKVEEQRLQMEHLEIRKKRVEAQINCEIGQIKQKFQGKLRMLTPYPRLLDEQEAKNAQLKQSNQKLYTELEGALKQVKVLEDRLTSVKAAKDVEAQRASHHLELELVHAQEQLEQLAKEKKQLQEEALQLQGTLKEARKEAAKIISRASQREAEERQAAQQRYAQLEIELSRSRAHASFTISNQQKNLQEMNNRIQVLSSSLDDALLQIRCLRNQASYLRSDKLIAG